MSRSLSGSTKIVNILEKLKNHNTCSKTINVVVNLWLIIINAYFPRSFSMIYGVWLVFK